MSAPAPSYGSLAPRLGPLRPMGHVGIVSFTLGLMVMLGLVGYGTSLAFGAMSAMRSATAHTTAAPVQAMPVVPTPSGSTLAFDQLWIYGDGNTIVAGTPTLGTSARSGESVIRVPVTLTNNTERDWNLGATTFAGTLNRVPITESTEGDWTYRTPIVAHTSVTLTKVFVGGAGRLALTVSAPRGVAMFTGRT